MRPNPELKRDWPISVLYFSAAVLKIQSSFVELRSANPVNQRRIFASQQRQDFQLEMTIRLFYECFYFLGRQKWILRRVSIARCFTA